jgi:hypothetical protein
MADLRLSTPTGEVLTVPSMQTLAEQMGYKPQTQVRIIGQAILRGVVIWLTAVAMSPITASLQDTVQGMLPD